MNLSIQNRQQVLTLLALLAIGLWVGDRLILSPLVHSWKDRSARIVDLRKSIGQGAQLVSREKVIRERWGSMKTNTLPTEVSAAQGRVMQSFDKWSQDSRISVTSIKPQWKRTADEYMTLECRVDAFGSLGTITRFLYDIEKDALGLKVDALELSARENDGSQLTLGLQVSGLVLSAAE